MIELERHIEILLLDNDCVTIPGLGGFVAHHVEARYDNSDGIFLPPLRTIGFNPQLTLNDSLLAQSYVEAYDLSYPEAMRRIEQEVKSLRKRLSDDGYYELNGIGRLFVNAQHKIEFTPFEAGILTPELYGLSSFEISQLQPSEETNEAVDKEEACARIIYIDSEKHTGHKMLNIRMSALRNMAVAAVVVSAFFFITSPSGWNRQQFQPEQLRSSVFNSIFHHEEKPAVPQPVQPKAAPKPVTPPVVEKQEEAKHYWSIVLCSHVSKKNAEDFRRQLAAEGLPDANVVTRKKIVKVLYGKYATREEAQTALRHLRDNRHFAQSWVLEVNN